MKATRQILKVDWHSVMDRRLGRHRLTSKDVSGLTSRVRSLIASVERERKTGLHRYRNLPHDAVMRQAVEDFAKSLSRKADNLVVLGIGGSALGNIALQTALNSPQYNLLSRAERGGPRLFVMDNVDPMHFAAMMEFVGGELPRTIFNVISKSGETAETASQFLIVQNWLVRKLGARRAAQQIVATTDAKSGTLRSIVEKNGYASLPVPDGVGGRFSVLSAVGLFSAAMCGIDIRSLLKGAADMDRLVRNPDWRRNPAAQLAIVNYLYYRRGQVMSVMMPYSNALYGLADWYRQLWAESLGKRFDATGKKEVFAGPTPIKALGTTDQHSQVQLYREGPNDKLITFLEVERFDRDVRIPHGSSDAPALAYLGGATLGQLLNAEKRATEMALLESERPCLTIRFPQINAYTVGQFIYLMEATTTLMGRLLGIDPYDQPGVELGKKITYHLMGRPGYEKMPRG